MEEFNNDMMLTATGVPNVTYLLQWSETCEFNTEDAISVTADASGELSAIANFDAGVSRMFYRYVYQAAAPSNDP